MVGWTRKLVDNKWYNINITNRKNSNEKKNSSWKLENEQRFGRN